MDSMPCSTLAWEKPKRHSTLLSKISRRRPSRISPNNQRTLEAFRSKEQHPQRRSSTAPRRTVRAAAASLCAPPARRRQDAVDAPDRDFIRALHPQPSAERASVGLPNRVRQPLPRNARGTLSTAKPPRPQRKAKSSGTISRPSPENDLEHEAAAAALTPTVLRRPHRVAMPGRTRRPSHHR